MIEALDVLVRALMLLVILAFVIGTIALLVTKDGNRD